MQETNQLQSINYAFIIGIGRSGTTLLSKLLNEHKSLMVSVEIDFLIFFHNELKSNIQFSKSELDRVVLFFEYSAVKHPALSAIINLSSLRTKLEKQAFKDYNTLTKFLHLQFNYFEKPVKDIKYIIDKNPSYSLHIDTLTKYLHQSKYIFIYRDYRSNILSRKQSIEFRAPNTAFNCYRWLFYTRYVYRKSKDNPTIFSISYESLVNDNKTILKEIYHFLNIESNEEVSEYYKTIVHKSIDFEQIKTLKNRYNKLISESEKPVYKDRKMAWKTELTQKDIEICEIICGTFAQKLGYKKSLKLSIFKRAYIKMITIFHYFWAVYDFYKEFGLYYINATIKLKRINTINKKSSKNF